MQHWLVVSYWFFRIFHESHLEGCWRYMMGHIGHPKTSVTNCPSLLHSIPQDRRPYFHCGGSLISCKLSVHLYVTVFHHLQYFSNILSFINCFIRTYMFNWRKLYLYASGQGLECYKSSLSNFTCSWQKVCWNCHWLGAYFVSRIITWNINDLLVNIEFEKCS